MQIKFYETRLITVKREAVERLTKCEKEGLCCGCLQPLGEQLPRRGLCIGCYHATRRAINSGKTTEGKQLSEGKMLEAKASCPRSSCLS